MAPPTDSRVQDIYDLSSEFVDQMAALRPSAATYQGIPGHDHRWDDFGPGGHAAAYALVLDFQKRLASLPEPDERWARLAQRVMRDHLDLEREWIDQGEHLVDLNNIASTFQSVRQVFDLMDTGSKASWENIVARLDGIEGALEGYRETLEEGRREGQVVAARQVRATVEQGRVNAGESSFFHRLPALYDKAGIADPALRARLDAAVPRACAAYAGLADYLESIYLPSANPKDAVGRERYARQTRRFLGMHLDPEETYAWGWEQVHAIEAEMRRVADRILPGAPLPEVFKLLKTDPARAARDRAHFLELMTARQQRALADLDGSHFDIPQPVKRVEVRIAPPGGALGAYYVQPTEDFSRPGTVWYSLAPEEQANIPLYAHITTAYHEGFPGHHLQCGIQVGLADHLSRLHRLSVWYPGYGEGWALYAEHLMNELGYFEKPEYVLGMLGAQLFRACRVVIDIGSHLELPIPQSEKGFHPGEPWTFDSAVEMLVTRAFDEPDYARSEVTRYLGWPGQAIAYKVGERVIMELRDELKHRQGAAFSLKDFHQRVLGSGPVGLDLLKDLVLAD